MCCDVGQCSWLPHSCGCLHARIIAQVGYLCSLVGLSSNCYQAPAVLQEAAASSVRYMACLWHKWLPCVLCLLVRLVAKLLQLPGLHASPCSVVQCSVVLRFMAAQTL